MACLIDSSLLLRHANAADMAYPAADKAIRTLHHQGESLRTAPQVFVEFRSVATRPVAVNGLGLSAADVETKSAIYEATFPLLPETSDIFPAWKALVQASGATGKQVHDARLVAICHVYGITHVLTFNVRHFARFASFGPGIIVVDPNTV